MRSSAPLAASTAVSCFSAKRISASAAEFHGKKTRRQIILSPNLLSGLVLTQTLFPVLSFAKEKAEIGNENPLIQKLLEKSNANRKKYAKERLEDYYRRNYKDYFESVEGSIVRKGPKMSEAEKEILEWLQKNR